MEDRADRERALGSLCESAARLIGASGTGLRRLRVSAGDSDIELEWSLATDLTTQPAADVGSGTVNEAESYVCAPSVGTFYHAPEPGAPPFVQVGDVIAVDQTIGIVETMKLMNPVRSELAGRVREILVGDGEPVEYQQPVVAVEPAESGPAGDGRTK